MYTELITMDDPQILNKDVDGGQPDFFDIAISKNHFNFSFDGIFHEEEAMIDEDNRFFGTHIREAIKIFKKTLKK